MDEWILMDLKEIRKSPSIEPWGISFDAVGKEEE